MQCTLSERGHDAAAGSACPAPAQPLQAHLGQVLHQRRQLSIKAGWEVEALLGAPLAQRRNIVPARSLLRNVVRTCTQWKISAGSAALAGCRWWQWPRRAASWQATPPQECTWAWAGGMLVRCSSRPAYPDTLASSPPTHAPRSAVCACSQQKQLQAGVGEAAGKVDAWAGGWRRQPGRCPPLQPWTAPKAVQNLFASRNSTHLCFVTPAKPVCPTRLPGLPSSSVPPPATPGGLPLVEAARAMQRCRAARKACSSAFLTPAAIVRPGALTTVELGDDVGGSGRAAAQGAHMGGPVGEVESLTTGGYQTCPPVP